MITTTTDNVYPDIDVLRHAKELQMKNAAIEAGFGAAISGREEVSVAVGKAAAIALLRDSQVTALTVAGTQAKVAAAAIERLVGGG